MLHGLFPLKLLDFSVNAGPTRLETHSRLGKTNPDIRGRLLVLVLQSQAGDVPKSGLGGENSADTLTNLIVDNL